MLKRNNKEVKHIYKGDYALPKEYEEVEYLKSTGEQWIETNIKPQYNLKLETKVLTPNVTDNYFCSVRADSGNTRFYLLNMKKNVKGYAVTNQSWLTSGFASSIANFDIPNEIVSEITDSYSRIEVNGVVNTSSQFIKRNLSIHTNTLPLFGGKTDNKSTVNTYSPNGTRCYYASFYLNNECIRKYIPCYRKSDSKPGMYDLVSGEFFTNQGIGEFITGPEVKKKVKFIIKDNRVIFADESLLPSEYRRVKYLKNVGTSYIDTEYMSDLYTSVFVIAKLNGINSGKNGPIIGNRDNAYNGVSLWASLTVNQMYFHFGTSTLPVANVIGDYDIHKYYFDKNGLKYDNRLVSTCVGMNFARTATLKLFATNPNASNINQLDVRRFIGNIYKCIIIKRGITKLYLIPSVRNSDNKPGMYDLVTNTFFTNEGDGEFEWEEL